MQPTEREAAAAQRLAHALLELLSANEEGRAQREAARRRREAERVQLAMPVAKPEVPEPLLLNARDAAKYLAISPGTLWTRTAPRGPIPVVKFGSAVRYSVSDLQAFVGRVRIKPKP